jgi:hypothetical protein
MDLKLNTSISRPPTDVFKFVGTDHLVNHPKWDPGIESLTPQVPGPMGVGTTLALIRRSIRDEDSRAGGEFGEPLGEVGGGLLHR